MKIIQIGNFPLYQEYVKGGIESSVFGLAREYTNEGHEVIVFDTPRTSVDQDQKEIIHREDREDFVVYRFSAKTSNNKDIMARIPDILKMVLAEEPDICHLHTTGYYSMRMYSVLRRKRIPVVVSAHGLINMESYSEIRRSDFLRTFMLYIMRSVAEFLFITKLRYLIVDTPYVKNAIQRYARQLKIWHKPQCVVIPQGVARPFYEIEADPQPYTMLAVGAIIKRKGYMQLVDVVALLKKMFPEIKLTIVGTVKEIPYYKELKDKIHAKKLDANINIVIDAPFDDLLELYRTSQLFLLGSMEESQGIVLCEAMAVGLPIVATDVGGVRNVVTDGVNGYLSNYGDIHSMVNHILSLLQLEDVRQAMSHKNKEDAEQYRWKSIADKVMEEYEEVLSKMKR